MVVQEKNFMPSSMFRMLIMPWSVLLLVVLFSCSLTDQLTVHTAKGPVKGVLSSAGETEVWTFKNIPYAKAPVGDMRFQLPREPGKWSAVDDLRQDIQLLCPQLSYLDDHAIPNAFWGYEDCLHLDVYVRKVSESEVSPLPVLVYFHGGGFTRGSKEEYGSDFLLRFCDVVLVIPNYRLGILGLLNHHDSVLPGNLALWDQKMALRWVSENIHLFGGDAGRVTIAGHEAGGVSVGLHVLSRASHGYFRHAISVSGSAFSPSLFDGHPSPTTGQKVVESLNCTTASVLETLACLQTAELRQLMEIQAKLRHGSFLPTVDRSAVEPFIPLHPKSLYQKGAQKNVNYLVGYAENEASLEVAKDFPIVLKHQHLDRMIGHFLRPYFEGAPNFDMVIRAVKYHYLKGAFIPSFESIEARITTIMTDFLYKSPMDQVMKLHGRKTENVFMYKFKQESASFCGPENRRCYGDEYFLFNKTSPNFHTVFNRSRSMTERTSIPRVLCGVYEDFIRTGHPGSQAKWKPFGDSRNYAEIADTIRPKSDHGRDDTEFWSDLVSDLTSVQNMSYLEIADIQPESDYSVVGSWGAAGLAILSGVFCVALVGAVVITKRKILTTSTLPVTSRRDVKFSRVDECV